MKFALEALLADRSECQKISDIIFKDNVTAIKRKKMVRELSDEKLNKMHDDLSWVSRWCNISPLTYAREQNLYTELSLEINRRKNDNDDPITT